MSDPSAFQRGPARETSLQNLKMEESGASAEKRFPPGLNKIKAAPEEMMYLRFVRDISMIEESDGLECHFEDVSNLRSFSVSIGKARFRVVIPTLYPMKSPLITLEEKGVNELAGQTRIFHFDERGRMIDDDLVGAGWRPMRGVHNLLKLLAFELAGRAERPLDNWLCSSVYSDEATCSAQISTIDGMSVAVVCEGFAAKQTEGGATVGNLARVAAASITRHVEMHARDDDRLEQVLGAAISGAQIADAWVGLSVCVAAVSRATNRVVTAHLGNVTCHVLQTVRKSRQLTVPHDAFNPLELERVPGTRIVKRGATVRFFDDLSRVSRCLGLSGCASFVSSAPTVATAALSAQDSTVVVVSDALAEAISPLEMSFLFCPLVSAEVRQKTRKKKTGLKKKKKKGNDEKCGTHLAASPGSRTPEHCRYLHLNQERKRTASFPQKLYYFFGGGGAVRDPVADVHRDVLAVLALVNVLQQTRMEELNLCLNKKD